MTAPKLTPPPPTQDGLLDRWLNLLWRNLTAAGQILWTSVDKTGSNLTDIETRNHADLQNINTATHTHLSATNHTDLTDGGDSTLHYHDADRVGRIPKTGIDSNSSGAYTTTLTYNETTRTVTIAPTGASFYVYVLGTQYTKTSESLTHAATGAGHFFYYDETGTFVTTTTPWDLLRHAPVAFVFQDATNGRRICFEERHHAGRDVWWHRNQHSAEGTKNTSGYSASDITGYTLSTGTDAACTFALATGRLEDEDIRVDTETLADNGPYNILERNGASGEWQLTRTNTVPFKRSGTVLQYNLNTAGTWSLATVANGDHVNYWVFGLTALPTASVTPTPSATQQIVIIPGQAVFTNLAGATAETVASISWGTIPFQELVPLYELTYKYSSAAGGTISLEAVTKVIGTAVSITAASATAHNSLTGLQGGTTGEYYHLTAAQVAALGSSSAVSNVISTPTTVATDTSYLVVDYLTITSDFTINGNVGVF